MKKKKPEWKVTPNIHSKMKTIIYRVCVCIKKEGVNLCVCVCVCIEKEGVINLKVKMKKGSLAWKSFRIQCLNWRIKRKRIETTEWSMGEIISIVWMKNDKIGALFWKIVIQNFPNNKRPWLTNSRNSANSKKLQFTTSLSNCSKPKIKRKY